MTKWGDFLVIIDVLCVSLLLLNVKTAAIALKKKKETQFKGRKWTGGIASLSSFVCVTEIPIIHRWRTFLFSATGMWSNSSWLPW